MESNKFRFTIIGFLLAVICLQIYNTYRINKIENYVRYAPVGVGYRGFVAPIVIDRCTGNTIGYENYIDSLKTNK